MIWSMATPHWSWDKILDSVGAGKNDPPCHLVISKRKTRQNKPN